MVRRYTGDDRLNLGRTYGTATASRRIKKMVDNGQLAVEMVHVVGAERLDTIAGKKYGDGRLWWVIAAASGIGWGLQVPAGTVVLVPTDLGAVQALVG